MRIDPKKLSEVSRKLVEATKAEEASAPAAGPEQLTAADQPDQIVFSERAAEVQRAARALAEVPEVRQKKVAEAKQKIAHGTLEIDPELIAEKIISGGI